jgi:HEAT repeat protein
VLASLVAAGPGRHLRYAESANRIVYAFVFGHKDTCRVYRRAELPRFERDQMVRRARYGAEHTGEPGAIRIAQFDFGRGGRPVHLVPTNDGKWLLTFANRAADGSLPRSDRIKDLEDAFETNVDYSGLPVDEAPAWPELGRALADPKPAKLKPQALSYAFLSKESSSGRMLIARQSEEKDYATEMTCFVVRVPEGNVELPDEDELETLLGHAEPLFRAGAAWALGTMGKPQYRAPLKGALQRSQDGGARVVIAAAIVKCGDPAGRKTLRALLAEAKDPPVRRAAALALAQLPPDKRDADALAAACGDGDAEVAMLAGMAVARLGKPAVNAVTKLSRASRPATRAAMARVLGRMPDDAAEQRLLALARDSDANVQYAAAVALTNPPRAILPAHQPDYARALDGCRRSRNGKAARRLCKLAAHAKLRHDAVLKALVDLAPTEEWGIKALNKLLRKDFETADDCKRWWKERAG